jgi:hypothetical protein
MGEPDRPLTNLELVHAAERDVLALRQRIDHRRGAEDIEAPAAATLAGCGVWLSVAGQALAAARGQLPDGGGVARPSLPVEDKDGFTATPGPGVLSGV